MKRILLTMLLVASAGLQWNIMAAQPPGKPAVYVLNLQAL